MIKRLLFTLTMALACATSGSAAISFGASGTPVINFDSAAPTPADGWATRSIGTAANSYTSATTLDAGVQTVTAASVTTALTSDATIPPIRNTINQWNSALGRIQSRPTTIGANILLATIHNDSG